MTMQSDRRAPGATRIPFEALVEISPSLGPSFEAQAVNVSDEGMHLRTAYLPEIGQPLLCRFELGKTGDVHVQGEVMWREEGESGGEFGLRFVDLDVQSAEALARIVNVKEKTIQPSGAKVRLHIEGLGFPMKARVKDASRKELTVGNELGFLQVGKELELEDAETGEKRPARIDRVEVEIDPESRIPRLVVGLRYGDESESIRIDTHAHDQEAEMHEDEPAKDATPGPTVMDGDAEEMPKEDAYASEAHHDDRDDHEEIEEESAKMKGSFAKNAAKVTPALLDFAKRAKATAGVLWEKRKARAKEQVDQQKRTTAPAPGGGLHASGRKVVRASDLVATPKKKIDTKRKVVIGAAAGLAVVLAFAAMHKSPKTEAAKPVATDATAAAAQPPPVLPNVPPPPVETVAVNALPEAPDPSDHHHGKIHVAPFGNGNVQHGNVLKLKMDGPIEKINGGAQPTGFSVSIPGRRSLEPAGPLASRDNRIASIKVSNEGAGSELDVAFKDGVPSYLVRAKGDTLEIVLASPGSHAGSDHDHDQTEKVASKKHHPKK
ncbi:MAG TPA: PilZ domain-containing protein [Polyangiaceae bacterium]